jgi:hypothetical protein
MPTGVLTSPYGMRNGRPHKGVDFGGGGSNSAEPIIAAAPGLVVLSRSGKGYGNYVVIMHSDENGSALAATVYAHMRSVDVSIGVKVERGQRIGIEGSTGHSYGSHLHFEIRDPDVSTDWQGFNPRAKTYDPMLYLNGNVSFDTGAVANAVSSNYNVDPGTPTNSRATVQRSGYGFPSSNTRCVNDNPTSNPPPPSVDPGNVSGPSEGPYSGDCSDSSICPSPLTKNEVVSKINETLDKHPDLDAEDRKFILFIARIESNFDPCAKNPTSSARGLYQFLDALANDYHQRLYGTAPTCSDRVDVVKATEMMISFYRRELLRYHQNMVSSGYTRIAGLNIKPTNHSARYSTLQKAVAIYGLFHHDGVGNAVNGIDKGGVAYAERKLNSF